MSRQKEVKNIFLYFKSRNLIQLLCPSLILTINYSSVFLMMGLLQGADFVSNHTESIQTTSIQVRVEDLVMVEKQTDMEVGSLNTCWFVPNSIADTLNKIQKAIDDLSTG